jgi:hypothetical protein
LKLVQAKNPSPKRAVEVAQGESSEFKPQYHKEKKKKSLLRPQNLNAQRIQNNKTSPKWYLHINFL